MRVQAAVLRTKPRLRVAHDFIFVVVQVRGPPRKRAVGDNVVVGAAHEEELFPIFERVLRLVERQVGKRAFYFAQTLFYGDVVLFFAVVYNVPIGFFGLLDDAVDRVDVIRIVEERVVQLHGHVVADAEMQRNAALQRQVFGPHHFLLHFQI